MIIVTLWNSFCLGKTKGNETLVEAASRMAVPFSPPYNKPKAFSFAQPTQKTIINQKKTHRVHLRCMFKTLSFQISVYSYLGKAKTPFISHFIFKIYSIFKPKQFSGKTQNVWLRYVRIYISAVTKCVTKF